MSVLIKGMKMPDYRSKLVLFPNGRLVVDHGATYEEYDAVPVPDHGDLIDRDEWRKSLIDEGETIGIDGFSIDGLSADDVCYAIENAPVVIPAERSEESICNNCDYRSDAGCSWCRRFERSEE